MEPSSPIYLRDFDLHSRARRPLHIARITSKLGGIAVSRKGPGDDNFSAFLSQRTQINEIAHRGKSGFLVEFTLSGGEWFLVRFIFPFGNRLGALVLFSPEWAARMDEKYFDFALALSIHEQTDAAFGCFGHWLSNRLTWSFVIGVVSMNRACIFSAGKIRNR
jgi:hypothetical protein